MSCRDMGFTIEGSGYTLFVDRKHMVITLLLRRNNSFFVFYDQKARDFWREYVKEIKVKKYNVNTALETLWRQYDEL